MKTLKIIILFVLLSLCISNIVYSRIVYITNNKSSADKIVYFTDNRSAANMFIYKTNNKSLAKDNNAFWYFTDNGSEADLYIYITNMQSEADWVIYISRF